jgi:hypothetical protein
MSGYEVEVDQRIVSSVPGRTGNWSVSTRMTLARVPVEGDLLCHHDGWASVVVKSVVLGPGCRVRVDLMPIRTDNPETLDELQSLVEHHGWEQHAGPWIGQT